jgi:hypothetical protein
MRPEWIPSAALFGTLVATSACAVDPLTVRPTTVSAELVGTAGEGRAPAPSDPPPSAERDPDDDTAPHIHLPIEHGVPFSPPPPPPPRVDEKWPAPFSVFVMVVGASVAALGTYLTVSAYSGNAGSADPSTSSGSSAGSGSSSRGDAAALVIGPCTHDENRMLGAPILTLRAM